MVLGINHILQCFVDRMNMHLIVVHETVVFGVGVLLKPDVKCAFALVVVSRFVAWRPIRTHHSNLHVVLIVVYQQQTKSVLLRLSKTPHVELLAVHARNIVVRYRSRIHIRANCFVESDVFYCSRLLHMVVDKFSFLRSVHCVSAKIRAFFYHFLGEVFNFQIFFLLLKRKQVVSQ